MSEAAFGLREGRVKLQPAELNRRHQAVMAFWYSRQTPYGVDGPPAAASRVGESLPPAGDLIPPMARPRKPAPDIYISYTEAKKWAVAHKLCGRRKALDLKLVNLARRARKLPVFVLVGAE